MNSLLKPVDLPSFEKLLAALVAENSISASDPHWDHSNTKVIEIQERWFRSLGFNTEIQTVTPNKHNLIATLGTGDGGLVLSGHSDTVPFDQNKWSSDPFKLRYEKSAFYGLGTCDMKGFFPIIIEALRKLECAQMKAPLIILSTSDEESSMAGARALCNNETLGGHRYAVIGEPTSLRPIHMHKGIMVETLRVSGQSGHSSNPSLGKSALEAMHSLIGDILDFRADIQARYKEPAFKVNTPTLNLGHVCGGDSPNRICGHCELSFDIRLLPGMDSQALRKSLENRLHEKSKRLGVNISLNPMIGEVEPFKLDRKHPFVEFCKDQSGLSAEAVNFATEAPHLSKLGFQTIVMGAGSIDQAHQSNEFLHENQIGPMATVLHNLIRRYCIDVPIAL